jgi:hypothetical protein
MSNAEMMRGLYQSFGAGDIPAVLAAMSPDIEWREAENNPYKMDGKPWVGPDAVVQNLFARLGEEWEVFNVTPASFHDAGQTVAVEGRYSGKYKATGCGPGCSVLPRLETRERKSEKLPAVHRHRTTPTCDGATLGRSSGVRAQPTR